MKRSVLYVVLVFAVVGCKDTASENQTVSASSEATDQFASKRETEAAATLEASHCDGLSVADEAKLQAYEDYVMSHAGERQYTGEYDLNGMYFKVGEIGRFGCARSESVIMADLNAVMLDRFAADSYQALQSSQRAIVDMRALRVIAPQSPSVRAKLQEIALESTLYPDSYDGSVRISSVVLEARNLLNSLSSRYYWASFINYGYIETLDPSFTSCTPTTLTESDINAMAANDPNLVEIAKGTPACDGYDGSYFQSMAVEKMNFGSYLANLNAYIDVIKAHPQRGNKAARAAIEKLAPLMPASPSELRSLVDQIHKHILGGHGNVAVKDEQSRATAILKLGQACENLRTYSCYVEAPECLDAYATLTNLSNDWSRDVRVESLKVLRESQRVQDPVKEPRYCSGSITF